MRDDRQRVLVVLIVSLMCGSRFGLAEGGMTIVALGDSTTAGTPGFQSPVEVPPDGRGNPQSQYAYWMMPRHPEWRVFNRGVNGERSDEIAQRFARDVAAQQPRVVIGDLFSVLHDPASPWALRGSPDGWHPDVAGYRAMGEALADVIDHWMASQPNS